MTICLYRDEKSGVSLGKQVRPFPCLVGDVGGTNVRFAIETAPGVFVALKVLQNRAFQDFGEALRFYMELQESIEAGSLSVKTAAVAIANPVESDLIRMTNSKWVFSIEEIRKAFGLDVFLVVNDFAALAMSLPFLSSETLVQCGGKEAVEGKAVGLIGAGTGLGVSGLLPYGNDWIPLETEGGHVSFSPMNELEMEILECAMKCYGHVSAERFISGAGLEFLYVLLAKTRGEKTTALKASEITERALRGTDNLCDLAVEVFCQMLGTVASNLALTLGARGGVFIGGGIVPRLGERFLVSGFRKRFEDKGRFSEYVSRIPVFVIKDTFAALKGVSILMDRHVGLHPLV